MPRLQVPAATAAKGPRLFELRTYENPSEKAQRAKMRMFGEMGEIEIFKRVEHHHRAAQALGVFADLIARFRLTCPVALSAREG